MLLHYSAVAGLCFCCCISPAKRGFFVGKMKVQNIIDVIGDTPLIRLNNLNRDVHAQIFVKAEFLNPGGSMKDRMAYSMVQDAEEKGLLKKGGTIVEPTSGNTGAGLAMIAAVKGYSFIAVMTEKTSIEKELVLKAYGASVVRTPVNVDHDHPDYYVNVAKRIAKEKNAFMPDQYNNQANPRAYYLSTGPEIWNDTDGKITHFVATMGTGGSITGTAHYLKERNPEIKVIGVDPAGSLLHHFYYHTSGKLKPYLVEGPGKEHMSDALDMDSIDEVIVVNDKDAFTTARMLVKKEGIFAGGSSGMAVFAALQLAKRLTKNDTIVILLPDSGRSYLSKLYNDDWMSEHNML